MRSDTMPPPILITGCARSGTSMVAGVVNLCGAFGGKMGGATRYNEKGFFENLELRENIVKPYLRKMGVDPQGQYPLPDPRKLFIPKDWEHRVRTVIAAQGYVDGTQWFCKGDKEICLLWPLWHFAFPTAKWVIVRRKSGDIINSCMKTGFMRAFSRTVFQRAVGAKTEQEGWLWWVHQHEERFREILHAGVDAKIVWPERMVDGDYEQMKETIEWLGLQWKDDEVKAFIEPKLWKARMKKQEEQKEKCA